MLFKIAQRPFVWWLVLSAIYVTLLWWAWYTGQVHTVWEADVTHISTAILAFVIIGVVAMGPIAWRADKLSKHGATAESDESDIRLVLELPHFLMTVCAYMGLICTVYGLIHMFNAAFVNANYGDPNFVQSVMPILGKYISLAFYGTAAGLSGFTALYAQVFVIEWALAVKMKKH